MVKIWEGSRLIDSMDTVLASRLKGTFFLVKREGDGYAVYRFEKGKPFNIEDKDFLTVFEGDLPFSVTREQIKKMSVLIGETKPRKV